MRTVNSQIAAARALLSLATFTLTLGASAQTDVAKVYKANCVLCHAVDGSGSSPTGKAMKAKDLKSHEVQEKSDAELGEFISQGKGKMPAFGKKLKAAEIKQLVAYIRQMASAK